MGYLGFTHNQNEITMICKHLSRVCVGYIYRRAVCDFKNKMVYKV